MAAQTIHANVYASKLFYIFVLRLRTIHRFVFLVQPGSSWRFSEIYTSYNFCYSLDICYRKATRAMASEDHIRRRTRLLRGHRGTQYIKIQTPARRSQSNNVF